MAVANAPPTQLHACADALWIGSSNVESPTKADMHTEAGSLTIEFVDLNIICFFLIWFGFLGSASFTHPRSPAYLF